VGNVTGNNGPYNLQFEVKLPVFHNELDDNPQKFLNEFKEYCQIKSIPKNIVILLLGTALRDRARIWFDANKEYVKTTEDFENEFKAEFFSIEQQVELRNKWNNRKYRYADGSLKSYFLKAKTEATYIIKGTGEYEINYIIVNQHYR